MAEQQIVTTLTTKRNEIEGRIEAYEREVERCRKDLSAVNATLAIFQATGDEMRPTVSVNRLFKRGEMYSLVCEAIKAAGKPLDTRELARAVASAKGMDADDRVLRKGLAYTLVNMLTQRAKRGQISRMGKRKGVMVWQIGPVPLAAPI